MLMRIFFAKAWLRIIAVIFVIEMVAPAGLQAAVYDLPQPGQMVSVSKPTFLPVLKGLCIDTADPFHLEFILDTKGKTVSEDDIAPLVEYFLAVLTIPDKELWVNLSPFETERIISGELSQTELGKELLGQDYILKQLASSLTYPETPQGKAYWNTINGVGANNHPPATNVFNKVWIMPDQARIKENDNIAVIAQSTLKVMTDEDYLALSKTGASANGTNTAAVKAFKQHILPLIAKEVNEGYNFAKLRQVYSSFILATWFKRKLRDSIFRYYIDQKKVAGIALEDKNAKEKIFNLYLEAFKKGAYNYVRRERVTGSFKVSRRQYFSGGVSLPAGAVTSDSASRVSLAPDLHGAQGADIELGTGSGYTGNRRHMSSPGINHAISVPTTQNRYLSTYRSLTDPKIYMAALNAFRDSYPDRFNIILARHWEAILADRIRSAKAWAMREKNVERLSIPDEVEIEAAEKVAMVRTLYGNRPPLSPAQSETISTYWRDGHRVDVIKNPDGSMTEALTSPHMAEQISREREARRAKELPLRQQARDRRLRAASGFLLNHPFTDASGQLRANRPAQTSAELQELLDLYSKVVDVAGQEQRIKLGVERYLGKLPLEVTQQLEKDAAAEVAEYARGQWADEAMDWSRDDWDLSKNKFDAVSTPAPGSFGSRDMRGATSTMPGRPRDDNSHLLVRDSSSAGGLDVNGARRLAVNSTMRDVGKDTSEKVTPEYIQGWIALAKEQKQTPRMIEFHNKSNGLNFDLSNAVVLVVDDMPRGVQATNITSRENNGGPAIIVIGRDGAKDFYRPIPANIKFTGLDGIEGLDATNAVVVDMIMHEARHLSKMGARPGPVSNMDAQDRKDHVEAYVEAALFWGDAQGKTPSLEWHADQIAHDKTRAQAIVDETLGDREYHQDVALTLQIRYPEMDGVAKVYEASQRWFHDKAKDAVGGIALDGAMLKISGDGTISFTISDADVTRLAQELKNYPNLGYQFLRATFPIDPATFLKK